MIVLCAVGFVFIKVMVNEVGLKGVCVNVIFIGLIEFG